MWKRGKTSAFDYRHSFNVTCFPHYVNVMQTYKWESESSLCVVIHYHSLTSPRALTLSVLGHRCKSDEAKKLPTTDEERIYPADTCGAAHDVRLALMQSFFKDVGVWLTHLVTLHTFYKLYSSRVFGFDLSSKKAHCTTQVSIPVFCCFFTFYCVLFSPFPSQLLWYPIGS